MNPPASPIAPPGAQLFVLHYSPGPRWVVDRSMKEQDLSAHLHYILSAGAKGSIPAAGPYADRPGGFALLFAASWEGAQAFVTNDPAVLAGVMSCTLDRVRPVLGAHVGSGRGAATAEQLVRRLYEAVPKRDMSATDVYGHDVVIHEAPSLPYGGTYAGPEGVVHHAHAYRRHWDALQAPSERELDPIYVCSADRVVILWRQRGHRGDTGFDMPAASAYRIADGRIVESRMFHFDTAAVSAFLGPASAGSSVAERDGALNRRLEGGEFVAALHEFFDDDVELAEVDQPATVGKAANVARERVFLSALERIGATLLASAVHGDVSFSEWRYEVAFKSGRSMTYHQTSRRRWRGGRVMREDFFHADFPAWFAVEMGNAMKKASEE